MAVVEALRLFGAVAILVGIRPEIAQTIAGWACICADCRRLVICA
jgi:hypothetical protein